MPAVNIAFSSASSVKCVPSGISEMYAVQLVERWSIREAVGERCDLAVIYVGAETADIRHVGHPVEVGGVLVERGERWLTISSRSPVQLNSILRNETASSEPGPVSGSRRRYAR